MKKLMLSIFLLTTLLCPQTTQASDSDDTLLVDDQDGNLFLLHRIAANGGLAAAPIVFTPGSRLTPVKIPENLDTKGYTMKYTRRLRVSHHDDQGNVEVGCDEIQVFACLDNEETHIGNVPEFRINLAVDQVDDPYESFKQERNCRMLQLIHHFLAELSVIHSNSESDSGDNQEDDINKASALNQHDDEEGTEEGPDPLA